VDKKLPSAEITPATRVPKQILGIKTDVIQRGAYRLYAGTLPEPLNSGESVRHPGGGFGTMTCLVRRGVRLFILSASHVLCPSGASAGDWINFVLPGLEFPVAALEEPRVRIFNGQVTDYDAAIAQVDPASVNSFLRDATRISDRLAHLDRGDPVRKVGRHGITFGALTDASAIENVPLTGGGFVQFRDQVSVVSSQPFAQPGDSGALVLEAGNLPVGMVIAGVDGRTLITPIRRILNKLNVSLVV
jgi:hypothetical protein